MPEESKDFYVPSDFGTPIEAAPTAEYEEGAIQVFGLGPVRLDLEEGRAQQKMRKYQTPAEKLVNAIVVIARKLYLEDKMINPKNILEEWDPNLKPPTDVFIQDFLETPQFKEKARLIGMEAKAYNKTNQKVGRGLTPIQHAVISSLTFPDGKPIHMKLKKHRIPWITFQGWLKDPNFVSYMKLNAEQTLAVAETMSIINLVQMAANSTSMKAVETVLAMTNRWDPNSKQLDSQQAVQLILQVLDEEIKDPELKDRIGARLSILSSNNPSTVKGELT